MQLNNFEVSGLSSQEVTQAREKFGKNLLYNKKENELFSAIIRIFKEPMMLLLLAAASIYFISGKIGDGIFLVVAIVFQTSISLYQYSRSKNALEKLKDFTQPTCKAIRNGKIENIKSEELVLGDCILLEEGTSVPADGRIIYSNDFSVNESILT